MTDRYCDSCPYHKFCENRDNVENVIEIIRAASFFAPMLNISIECITFGEIVNNKKEIRMEIRPFNGEKSQKGEQNYVRESEGKTE